MHAGALSLPLSPQSLSLSLPLSHPSPLSLCLPLSLSHFSLSICLSFIFYFFLEIGWDEKAVCSVKSVVKHFESLKALYKFPVIVIVVALCLILPSLQKFASNNHTVVQRESVAKLQKHLETIVSSLPIDLQSVIKT